MPEKASGRIKTGIVKERQKNGDIYVFERQTRYDPEKRYNVTVSKVLLGKIPSGETEMVETRYKKGSRLKSQLMDIVCIVSDKSGITGEVLSAFGEDQTTARQILTLAWYYFVTGEEDWSGIHDWFLCHEGRLPWAGSPLTEEMCGSILEELGKSTEIRESFFSQRMKTLGDADLLALDLKAMETNQHLYRGLEIYSLTSRQPVFCGKVPADTFPEEAAKYPKVEVVAESGPSAEDTMLSLTRKGIPFVLEVPREADRVSALIKKNRDRLMRSTKILFADPDYSGMTETLGLKESRVHVHLYYSVFRNTLEDGKFRERFSEVRTRLQNGEPLDAQDQRFADSYMTIRYRDGYIANISINYDGYDRENVLYGFLVLASDREKDKERAMEKYKIRERAAGSFNKPGKWDENTLDGEIFVRFLSRCMQESFLTMINYQINTLGMLNGDARHDTREQLQLERQLKSWLLETSPRDILKHFQEIEQDPLEESPRDELFIRKLGILQAGK